MSGSNASQPRQVLLLTIPRSGSQLLDRMLKQQSEATYLWHPFLPCFEPLLHWLCGENPSAGMQGDVLTNYEAARRKGMDEWREALENAERAKKVLIHHTHPFYITSLDVMRGPLLPAVDRDTKTQGDLVPGAQDMLLHPGTVPVFSIRDPRLVVPSGFRILAQMGQTSEACSLISASPRWNRAWYDWFVSHGVQPIVVDGDDYMTSEGFVRKLCREVGLNEHEIWFNWDKGYQPEDTPERAAIYRLTQQTLMSSNHMDPQRAAKNMNMNEIESKWRTEFGEDGAKIIQKAVHDHLPDYEYLYERRLRL